MKIITYHQHNPEIEVIELYGELTGRGAIRLADFLYTSLDEGRRCKIINLAHVKKADGLDLNVLEYFIHRGMRVRLFNVGLEIQNLLSLSGKKDVIKTYNCQETDEAISQYEKEIPEEKCTARDDVNGRRYARVNVSFQAEIKRYAAHGGEVMYKAVIRNLSEGGILTDQITEYNKETGEGLKHPQMVGKEFSDITFTLNGDSRLINANGECVWENSEFEDRCAGIRFKDLSKVYKDRVSEYVCENMMF
ncbi:MAG: PilZ domain-containing protein [Planctomycetota bacterium]|jgi:ABC-type transporter Mla MlaB component